jgi:hypothetical protein
LPGLVLGSPHSSTIGSDEWLLNTIVLRNSFLAGLSTNRAAAGNLRPQMNFLISACPQQSLEIRCFKETRKK